MVHKNFFSRFDFEVGREILLDVVLLLGFRCGGGVGEQRKEKTGWRIRHTMIG